MLFLSWILCFILINSYMECKLVLHLFDQIFQMLVYAFVCAIPSLFHELIYLWLNQHIGIILSIRMSYSFPNVNADHVKYIFDYFFLIVNSNLFNYFGSDRCQLSYAFGVFLKIQLLSHIIAIPQYTSLLVIIVHLKKQPLFHWLRCGSEYMHTNRQCNPWRVSGYMGNFISLGCINIDIVKYIDAVV